MLEDKRGVLSGNEVVLGGKVRLHYEINEVVLSG